MTLISALNTLYEIDNYLWLEETIEILEKKQFSRLDLENLIEELKDLGSEKKHRVESLLEQIIRHLLMCQYWEAEYERNAGHWKAEIVGFRTQLKKRLTTNFRNYLEKELPVIYQDALAYVRQKTRLQVNFPQECPYTLAELLDSNWFPDDE